MELNLKANRNEQRTRQIADENGKFTNSLGAVKQ